MKTLHALMVAGIVGLAIMALCAAPASASAGTACLQYASKQCISNISYWYDSCGNISAVNQNCNSTNQVCSNGTCVTPASQNPQNPSNPYYPNPSNPGSGYIQNYRTYCYSNNVYWYDSRGSVQGIYQNCQDSNSCTVDSCQDNACKSVLKCDGSTCTANSQDYITYCGGMVQNPTNPQNPNPQNPGQPGMGQAANTVISVFGKRLADNTQWSKTVDLANGETIEFLMVVKNISPFAVNNVLASADLTSNITYSGNLTIDGAGAAGSVISGIDLGPIAASSSKIIYFTATAQAQSNQNVQITARATANNMADADTLAANISTNANASAAAAGSPFFEFIKQWYLWIIVVIVLIALFIIIFRRLSTNP